MVGHLLAKKKNILVPYVASFARKEKNIDTPRYAVHSQEKRYWYTTARRSLEREIIISMIR